MSKVPWKQDWSILVLTLWLFLRTGVLCSTVLRWSEPLVCFQINKRLCVISLLVPQHIYCDLTKEPRNNTAQQKGKKVSWWLIWRDHKVPRPVMFTKKCSWEAARTLQGDEITAKGVKAPFSSPALRNLTLEMFSKIHKQWHKPEMFLLSLWHSNITIRTHFL